MICWSLKVTFFPLVNDAMACKMKPCFGITRRDSEIIGSEDCTLSPKLLHYI